MLIVDDCVAELAPLQGIGNALFDGKLCLPTKQTFGFIRVGIGACHITWAGRLQGNWQLLTVYILKRSHEFFHRHAMPRAEINDSVRHIFFFAPMLDDSLETFHGFDVSTGQDPKRGYNREFRNRRG